MIFGYDLKQAFTYIFQDKDRLKKVGGLFGIIILNFVLLTFSDMLINKHSIILALLSIATSLISIFISLYLVGYFFKNANERICNKSILASLNDIKGISLVGLKYYGIGIIYAILLAVIAGIGTFAVGGLVALLFGAKTFVNISLECIWFISLFVFFVLFFCAIYSLFATNLKLKTAFDFKLIHKIMTKHYKELFAYAVISILIGIVSMSIFFVLIITIVGVVLIPVIIFYLYFVNSDILAQTVRNIIKSDEEMKLSERENG